MLVRPKRQEHFFFLNVFPRDASLSAQTALDNNSRSIMPSVGRSIAPSAGQDYHLDALTASLCPFPAERERIIRVKSFGLWGKTNVCRSVKGRRRARYATQLSRLSFKAPWHTRLSIARPNNKLYKTKQTIKIFKALFSFQHCHTIHLSARVEKREREIRVGVSRPTIVCVSLGSIIKKAF